MATHSSILAWRTLWTEACNTVQDIMTKNISKKKKYKNAKWLSEEALQIAEKNIGKDKHK